jgi:hypothetical protein
MRAFVTGATGFIGSAVTEELMTAGHTVTALARSEETAKKLSVKGIQPILGNLDDMESLRKAAAAADGVIHLAFMHSPSQIPFWKRMGVIFGGLPTGIAKRFMAVASESDRRAIDTLGDASKARVGHWLRPSGPWDSRTLASGLGGPRRKRMSPIHSRPDSFAPGLKKMWRLWRHLECVPR